MKILTRLYYNIYCKVNNRAIEQTILEFTFAFIIIIETNKGNEVTVVIVTSMKQETEKAERAALVLETEKH